MKLEKAEVGDIIRCQGRIAIIDKIICQYDDNGKYGIEGYDTKGKYFMWKQRYDGGMLIKKENTENDD